MTDEASASSRAPVSSLALASIDACSPARMADLVEAVGIAKATDPASRLLTLSFMALGFKHSIANMFLIPAAMMYGAKGVSLAGLIGNILRVTAGHVVGGGVGVAGNYWLVYLRSPR